MRKWETITKGYQHKEYLFIPKFCASLPDLLAIECYARPAWKHWQQKKDPRLNVRCWNWCQGKPLLLAITVSEIQISVLDQGQCHLNSSQGHPILPRYDFSKYRALFSWRKLCYNGKNFLTWCNISFQFPTFASYYLHKLHQIPWACFPNDTKEK